jgi:hypothetical protein
MGLVPLLGDGIQELKRRLSAVAVRRHPDARTIRCTANSFAAGVRKPYSEASRKD